jgi:hypothetical protein
MDLDLRWSAPLNLKRTQTFFHPIVTPVVYVSRRIPREHD